MLDAGALTPCKAILPYCKARRGGITPHLGEMAKLTCKTIPIYASIKDIAREFSAAYNVIVVLKAVKMPLRWWRIRKASFLSIAGNQAMATAGMGMC